MKKPVKGTIQLFIDQNTDKNIKSLINEHSDLLIESTSYTKKVKLFTGVNYLFSDGAVSKQTFIAHSKIKSDINSSGFKPFEIKKQINYFGFGSKLNVKELVCIDLNSAYPTELKKQDFINQATFDYLTNKIDKIDRLRSLGMLATNKIVQEIKNKKQFGDPTLKENPTACVFFSVSHAVGELLNFLFYAYPNYVYFYWVDGIFIHPDLIDTVCEFFEQNKFGFKIEPVEDLRLVDECLIFNKWSAKKEIFEKKILFLPKEKQKISKDIWNFIT